MRPFHVAALLLCLGAFPTLGQSQTPPSEELLRACKPLFNEGGWVVRNRLFAFERVFGKQALTWTSEDYDKVIALARACHGLKVGENFIDGQNWVSMIGAAKERVLGISQLAKIVEEYGQRLGVEEITLPPCWAFLDYKFDGYEQSDTSGAFFGKPFMAMNDSDLAKSVLFVNQCLAYLPQYALSSRGIRINDTTNLLNVIMDRALIIEKRRKEFAEWQKGADDMVLVIDGIRVLPTFLAADTREMLLRYNKAANQRRRFTPETVAILVRLSDRVVERNLSAYDKAYAMAVKEKVQEEIFRRR